MANVQLRTGNNDWATPEWLWRAIANAFDGIALDPCCNDGSTVEAAERWIGVDALALPWRRDGLIYVNPPYGDLRQGRWTTKVLVEKCNGAEIMLLVPSRTDAQWFHRLWAECTAVCFIGGRLTFQGAPNPAPFPSCLIYFGPRLHLFNMLCAREELGIVSYGSRWGYVHAREATE